MIMRMQGMTNNVEVRNGPAGYPGATGNTSLTQEFIDMFELTSGKLPKDDTNYDPQNHGKIDVNDSMLLFFIMELLVG